MASAAPLLNFDATRPRAVTLHHELHDEITRDHRSLADGDLLHCCRCGSTRQVSLEKCLRSGWQKCKCKPAAVAEAKS